MPYEKKSYKKFNGKDKTTLNPSSLTLNQGRPEPKRKRGKLASLMSEDAFHMTLDVVSPVCSSTLLRMQNTKNTYSLSRYIEVAPQ